MNLLLRLLSILALFGLSACAAPVLLFGGAVGAGATLSKEKTVGSSLDDSNIWTKIKAAFLQHHKEVEGILSNISVEVSEGRVLLTGHVASADERLKVLKIVWEQAGVREVINEIRITDQDNTVSNYAQDVWITTQVKSKMLANKEIRSINYNVETVDSIVYILGVARSEEELAQVINEAESVKKVTKVVNYIKVKGQHSVTEEEAEPIEEQKPQAKKTKPATKAKAPSPKKTEYIEHEDSEHEIEIGHDE